MSKILLVEDDKFERQGLKKLLETKGHNVDTAENGKFALDALKDNEYDIIITDLVMPVTDGIRFLHSLSQAGDNTPVIVMTGHENIENMLSAYELGAIDILYKPYDFDQLCALISKVQQMF